jgi:putative Mg2+ transporter-C (MgtC) family protein
MTMQLDPTWADIAVRLLLTVAAAAVIGIDREARGHAAGLRTTILVALAASVAMIQANILLAASGKTATSFSDMDVLRLPLGILTGVGFIGGGAILRRGDMMSGVTTAATLWIATVIGLCMGGGQIALGWTATAVAFATLSILKSIDDRIPRVHRARMTVESSGAAAIPDLASVVGEEYATRFIEQRRGDDGAWHSVFEVRWRAKSAKAPSVELLSRVDQRFPVRAFEMV